MSTQHFTFCYPAHNWDISLMVKAAFRFYEELNEYLPEKVRKKAFSYSFTNPTSVKESIASLGVPPDEVDLVLVNGVAVDFSYIVREGDRVSVYPIFETFDITGVTRVRERPLKEVKGVTKK